MRSCYAIQDTKKQVDLQSTWGKEKGQQRGGEKGDKGKKKGNGPILVMCCVVVKSQVYPIWESHINIIHMDFWAELT